MTKRLSVCILLLAAAAHAQPPQITEYELRFYQIGASQPVTIYTFTPADITCGNTPPVLVDPAVNPTALYWDDETGTGCMHVLGVIGWPVPGNYEATLVAKNLAGESDESVRSNGFFTQAAPAAPTGVILGP